MTLDEAIKRYTSNAFYEKSDGNLQGCLEFRQLADWLKDYKRLLEQAQNGDCISRQALLEEVKNGIKAGNYEEGYERYAHINDMDDIIECIEYADSVQPKAAPCEDCQYKEWLKGEVEQAPKIDGDCISREGAIEVVRSHWEDILHPVNLRIQEELKELPSVNPIEPKTGHWIDGHCSECGCDVPAYIVDWKWQKDMDAKYCPNCGCRMSEVSE